MEYGLKALHNISRPGEPPRAGDLIEIECVGGFVKEVDPVTRKSRDANKRFIFGAEGDLTPAQGVRILNA